MSVNLNVDPIGAGMRTNIAVSPNWFPGLSHVEIMQQIAAYGFRAFESLSARDWEDRVEVGACCRDLGILVGAVSSSGSIKGDGPLNAGFHDQFEENIRATIPKAHDLGAKALCGAVGAARDDMSKEEQMDNIVAAGKRVAPMLEDAGMTLVWEPLNIKVDHAGYFLVYSQDAAEIVRRTDSPAVKILFDVYHQQISEGDVIRNIREYAAEIGHFHFADNPGRNEPTTGELNYNNIFKAIYETGYRGVVSAEMRKTLETEQLLRVLAACDVW